MWQRAGDSCRWRWPRPIPLIPPARPLSPRLPQPVGLSCVLHACDVHVVRGAIGVPRLHRGAKLEFEVQTMAQAQTDGLGSGRRPGVWSEQLYGPGRSLTVQPRAVHASGVGGTAIGVRRHGV